MKKEAKELLETYQALCEKVTAEKQEMIRLVIQIARTDFGRGVTVPEI
jgi:hypothetical protein